MGASSSSHSFVAAAHPIEGGLKDGHVITIKGIFLKALGTRFIVNLHEGFSNDDIAFHFNPRFEAGWYVVCNTKQNGRWGYEERKMHMPFQTEKPFEIRIVVKKAQFEVLVDGDHFVSYTHRVNYKLVNYISVTGPVEHIDISVTHSKDQSTCLSKTPYRLVCHYSHTCYQAVWFHETHCHELWDLRQPRNYCQTTKATITQTVIHIVQSTPGQKFANPVMPPMT